MVCSSEIHEITCIDDVIALIKNARAQHKQIVVGGRRHSMGGMVPFAKWDFCKHPKA